MRKTYVNRNPVVPALLCIGVLLSACGGGGSGGTNGGTDGGGGGNNPGPAGSVQFDASSVSVNTEEGAGTAVVTITRTGGSNGAISVTLKSADGTAIAGDDYTPVNSSVTFAAGDTAAKTIAVAILPNSALESDESLTLTLSAATGGATLGTPNSATVTIVDDDPPDAPVLAVSAGPPKQLEFTWASVTGATHYRLLRDPDGASGFTQVGGDLAPGSTRFLVDIASVHRHNWLSELYRVAACNTRGCTSSTTANIRDAMLGAIGYFKASNTAVFDQFGKSIALSADGNTLAVGAFTENGTSGADSGAVYVFARSAAGWTQQQYLKASNAETGDFFGAALALSANGDTLAVGASGEDGGARGVNGPDNNAAQDAGAVYVFTRSAGNWSQQAYVKAANSGRADEFGTSVTLSADGDVLAVGATGEDSDGGSPDNDLSPGSGAAYLFVRLSGFWDQRGFLKAFPVGSFDQFGTAVALSGDGRSLAVGAPLEDINGRNSGAAYVYTCSACPSTWSFLQYVRHLDPTADDNFGGSVAFDADGSTLAVGATGDDGIANAASNSGAVYVFSRDPIQILFQKAYVQASNTQADDQFGHSVALSADGLTLAVGAIGEDSGAAGVDGDQSNDAKPGAGAAYVFDRGPTDETWLPQAYVKAPNPDGISSATVDGDAFGFSVALSEDGGTLAVGAGSEDSAAIGINGDRADNSATNAGAAYLY